MSRLAPIDDCGRPPPKPDESVLRHRRRSPLHPEEIQKRLRTGAAKKTVGVGPTPYGWLVILYLEEIGPNGFPKRVVRSTAEDATYADACTLLEQEMLLTGSCDAWIVAKRVPNQKTVRA